MRAEAIQVHSNVSDLMPELLSVLRSVLACGCETCRIRVLLMIQSGAEVPADVAAMVKATDPRQQTPAGEVN